jgi:hypothetical protein
MLGIVYGTRSHPYFGNNALWVLPGLITLEAPYAWCIRRLPLSYPLLLALSYPLCRRHDLDRFRSVDLSLLGLNHLLAGVVAKRFGAFRRLAAGRGRAASVAALCCAGTAAAVSVGNVWYAGEHYALSLGAGLAGILSVVCVSMLLASLLGRHARARAFLGFTSGSSLFVFCFHVFSSALASALLAPIGPGPPLNRAATTAVVSIALLVPFNLLVRRFVPELIGIRRGGPSRDLV